MNKLQDNEMRERISDLLCVQNEITNRIHNEIDEVMRGKGRTNAEIRDSIIYILDDKLR